MSTAGFWAEEYRRKAAAADPLVQSGRSDRGEWIEFLYTLHQMLGLLDLRRTHDLLNVGCANGLTDIVLSACCRSLLAIEPVEELAALARDNLSGCPNVTVAIARGDSIPSEDARFDRALFLEVIQLMTPGEARRTFAELGRVVRPGGRIVIGSVPDARRKDAFLAPYLRGVREATHLSDEQKHAIVTRNHSAHWYDPEELMGWWRELGGEPRLHTLSERDPVSDSRFHLVVDILV